MDLTDRMDLADPTAGVPEAAQEEEEVRAMEEDGQAGRAIRLVVAEAMRHREVPATNSRGAEGRLMRVCF